MMTREDLMKKTVKELREMAKKYGVQGYSKLSKSELVTYVKEAIVMESTVEEEVSEMGEVKEIAVNSEEEVVSVNRDQAMPLKVVKKMWNGKEKTRYVCPVCGVRIYNPNTDHFCFNCGQKLENSETK